MNVFYSSEYVRSTVEFETARKSRWIADSLLSHPIEGVKLVAPEPLVWEQVAQVHDPDYVRAVQTGTPRDLAESQGFVWNPGLWPMVLASNGGAVAGALDALQHGMSGSLSSGMHHARHERGVGFCTFNGLVLSARAALAAGAESVLILDVDAHCGGGTASLIAEDPRIWQRDISVNSFDHYLPVARASVTLVAHPGEYLGAIARTLESLPQTARFDLCLYNAGMDPFEGCSVGGLAGISRSVLAARERLVFQWCRDARVPVAFCLAGGYLGPALAHEGLVALHRLTLSAACS